jgi:ADP-heptose:LPS heptosyltransferase
MKILIIKLGAMGDVLRTTSVLKGLKEKYKSSEITWVTKKVSTSLLESNPLISKIIHFTEEGIKKIKNKKFDLIFNLDEEYEACKLADEIKGKIIGFYFDKNKKICPTKTNKEWYDMSRLGKKPKNDILKKKNKKTYQKILQEILEINSDYDEIIYNLTDKQKTFGKNFLRHHNLKEKDLIIGLNTGAGSVWPSKKWPITKTINLIEKLQKELDAKIILLGGPNEIERNKKICSMSNAQIINPGSGYNLSELPAIINCCKLFITTDTLVLHLALALKRKIIALFGPTPANEIKMYNLGHKIVSKSTSACSFKPDCKSMEKISVNEVFKKTKELINENATVIITSFKEKNLEKAIKSVMKQKIKKIPEIIIVSPDKEAKNLVKKYSKVYKNIKYFKDPGKGKSYALNLLFKDKSIKNEILIFTDGDITLEENAIENIKNKFNDPAVGCITGRVISSSKKNTKFGYWSHLLADVGAHKIREKLSKNNKFLECSGYLFAFRNNIIKNIPLDVPEDTVIPYIFWEKGYKIKYVDDAIVYVKNPNNLKDWLTQRVRTAKAHENLKKYFKNKEIPKVKSLSNEIKKGIFSIFTYPRSMKEFMWTAELYFARLYMWLKVHLDTKIKNKQYKDNWERIESTK